MNHLPSQAFQAATLVSGRVSKLKASHKKSMYIYKYLRYVFLIIYFRLNHLERFAVGSFAFFGSSLNMVNFNAELVIMIQLPKFCFTLGVAVDRGSSVGRFHNHLTGVTILPTQRNAIYKGNPSKSSYIYGFFDSLPKWVPFHDPCSGFAIITGTHEPKRR